MPQSRPPRNTRKDSTSPRPGTGFTPDAGVPRYLDPSTGQGSGAWVSFALIGGGISAFAGYMGAEASLASSPHYLHWAAMMAAGVLGGVVGAAGGVLRERRRWR